MLSPASEHVHALHSLYVVKQPVRAKNYTRSPRPPIILYIKQSTDGRDHYRRHSANARLTLLGIEKHR